MGIILCDISAWQYYRTPPAFRYWGAGHDCCRSNAGQCEPVLASTRSRSNASEVDRALRTRLFTDLKGLTLPVHVIVDKDAPNRKTRLVHPHRLSRDVPASCRMSLGGGLEILSIDATMAIHFSGLSRVQVAKMMFEACGLFSVLPSNPRIDAALFEMSLQGMLAAEVMGRGILCAKSDERGAPISHPDPMDDARSWTPCFNSAGQLTNLWRRPPLTNISNVRAVLGELSGYPGLTVSRPAASMVRDGAASPEEVRANMLLCSGASAGGEAWGSPSLNRIVPLTNEARALARTSFCVADCLWPDSHAVLEIQGEAFHKDKHGFYRYSGRRAALESMGYHYLELTHEQMANLELLDSMLPGMAKRLGFALRKRTAAFLKNRNALHAELFGTPYDPA